MKRVIEVASYLIILGGSMILGFLGRPAEMGLAIVAGAVAFAFANLDKFSRIKGAGFEAELREKIEAVIEKETEPFVSGEESKTVPNVSNINTQTRLIVNALHHPEYTWRYLGGLKEDTKLQKEEILKTLNWLSANGYVRQSQGKHGAMWSLTDEGRYLSAVIDFSGKPA